MFSRLFKSARSFIDLPQAATNSATKSPKSPNATMARTRNQRNQNPAEGDDLNDESSIIVNLPTPSSKRKSHKISSNEQPAINSPSPKKRKTLPVRAKDADSTVSSTKPVVEIPVVSALPAAIPKQGKDLNDIGSAKKHKKFGSEEPEGEIFSTAPDTQEDIEASADEELDDEASSDDDAPEEVGAEDAAKDVKARVQSTAEAIQSLRKKRKGRPSKIDKVTTEEKIPEQSAEGEGDDDMVDVWEAEAVDAEQPDLDTLSASPDGEEDGDEGGEEIDEESEDESSDEEEASPPVQITQSRKTTFDQFSERPLKDRKVGSTTYRVTKVENRNLAPKADRNARAVKESWLQGRSAKGIGANRKPMKQGFFRK